MARHIGGRRRYETQRRPKVADRAPTVGNFAAPGVVAGAEHVDNSALRAPKSSSTTSIELRFGRLPPYVRARHEVGKTVTARQEAS
jgi:hypothetical protein